MVKKAVLILCAALLILTGCFGKAVGDKDDDNSSLASTPTKRELETTNPAIAQPPPYIDGLVQSLAEELSLATMEPANAIKTAYKYVVTNYYFDDPVGLDLWRYLGEETKPIPFLENRSLSPLLFSIASCEDFAAVLVLLLQAVNIEAEYVAGYTLSVDQKFIDHAWVIVKQGDNWYHLDPQLEHNVVRNSTLSYRFFMKTDDEMIMDHRWGENLVELWKDMPQEEKNNIRSNYSYPPCNTTYPTTPPEPVTLPLPTDSLKLDMEISKLRDESGKGKLSPLILNIEPPILVAQYHITPPLLPKYINIQQFFKGAEGYGKSLLSASEIQFYHTLSAKLDTITPLSFTVEEALGQNQLNRVIDYVLYDNPQYYWANIGLSESGGIITISMKRDLESANIQTQKQALENSAIMILSVLAGKPDMEIALGIYDYLGTHAYYDPGYKIPDSGNAYGSIVGGAAYCDGYARGFQYLVSLAGIENIYIVGRNTSGTSHAWNAIRLDGNWYYVDVTWGRSSTTYGGTYHDFFGMSLEEASIERIWDSNQYTVPLPDSDSNQYDFYNYFGYSVSLSDDLQSTISIREIAEICNDQLLKKDNLQNSYSYSFVELKAVGSKSNYFQWKNLYTKELFLILKTMEELAVEENLPFSVSTDTEVSCYFNDDLQVVSFYPKVQQVNPIIKEEA